jgi:TRAP-type C4-dicarboxylate transport system permease small subunit
MLDRLRRSADLSSRIAAVVVLLALLATVVLGVAFRALGEPLIWSDELARYLMVWLAFIGWILASRRRSHIRITLVIERLPPPFRRILEALIQVALLVLGAFLVRDGFILVERNLDVETVSLPVSSAVVYVPIVFAGLATALQAVAQIVELFVPGAESAALGATGGKVL